MACNGNAILGERGLNVFCAKYSAALLDYEAEKAWEE